MSPDDVVCDRMLREGSKSFHLASRALPSRLRGPTRAIYAFCRTADDAVDGGAKPMQAADELDQRLDRVYGSVGLDSPVDRAFARVVEAYRIPQAIPRALVEGMRWDAEGRVYDSIHDLHGYAARVASSVGVMMTLVMGERSPWILARACDLGVAMQLTNIARDVGEDANMGRIYLPMEWVAEASVEPQGFLRSPEPTTAIRSLVQRLLGEASVAYQRARPGIDQLPQDCQFAIRTASLLYADIGRVIAGNGFDSISTRAVVSPLRKLWLLVRAALTVPSATERGASALAPPIDCLPATAFLVGAVVAADAPRVLELAA